MMARLPWKRKTAEGRRAPRSGPVADRRLRRVVTPEGVALPFAIGSRAARASALLLDLLFIVGSMVGTTLLLAWVAGGFGGNRLDQNTPVAHARQALAIAWIIAMFLYRNAYFLFFELGPRGATPGKRICGLRIAARDGGRLTTEAVIARNLVRDIELFMPLVFLASAWSSGADGEEAGWAGLVWFAIFVLFPFFNRDALRCGDVIAGTWVVDAPRRKLEKAMSLGEGARGQSTLTGAAYRFGEAELAVYGEYELQVLERVLRDGREEALAEVAATICAKIGWSAGSGDERAFLEAYYTQLRERLERGMRFGQRKADKFVPDARQATSSAWRFTATELSYYGEQQLDVLEQVLRADDPTTLGDVAARIGGKIGRDVDTADARPFLEAYYAQLREKLAGSVVSGVR